MPVNSQHAINNGFEPLAGLARRARSTQLQPQVFDYADLWQGDRPLLQSLRDIYGNRKLDSLGGSYGWPVRYRQVEDYERLGITTLAEYLDAFRHGGIRLPYLRHMSLNRALPALRPFLKEPDEFKPNWADRPWLDRLGGPELFIGQRDTVFGNVHQDQVAVHVGFVQLEGEKEFIIFPPEDGQYLYRIPGRQFPYELRNSQIHFAELENFERFPVLRKASPQSIVLRAGEAMFLPADWWHTTRNLTDSVSYSLRIVNRTNVLKTIARHFQGVPRLIRRQLNKRS